MFSLKRIVIKDHLFMIIENLIERVYLNVFSEGVYLNVFSAGVQCGGSVRGFSAGVHRVFSLKRLS